MRYKNAINSSPDKRCKYILAVLALALINFGVLVLQNLDRLEFYPGGEEYIVIKMYALIALGCIGLLAFFKSVMFDRFHSPGVPGGTLAL